MRLACIPCASQTLGAKRQMADATNKPEFRLDGLFGVGHPSVTYVAERTQGWLVAELNEACRKRVADMQGRDIGPKSETRVSDRKAIAAWIDDAANKASYEALRSELRTQAQTELDAGTYGDRVRGPVAASPRVLAVFGLIVKLQAARKDKPVIINPDEFSAGAKTKAVADFERETGSKYARQIAEATAHLPKPAVSAAIAGL